jgi:hypothetical protein
MCAQAYMYACMCACMYAAQLFTMLGVQGKMRIEVPTRLLNSKHFRYEAYGFSMAALTSQLLAQDLPCIYVQPFVYKSHHLSHLKHIARTYTCNVLLQESSLANVNDYKRNHLSHWKR